MKNIFSISPFQALIKLFIIIIPSIGLIINYRTDKVEAIPISLLITISIAIYNNFKLYTDSINIPHKPTKILLVISFSMTLLAFFSLYYSFQMHYNELISVVKTHVCSKDGSDTVILFSSIMDKKDYLCSIVFYFLGYISHVWDFICSFVMYVADESGEDKGEGFDVTVAKTN